MIEQPKKERRFLKAMGRVGEIILEKVLIRLGSNLIKKIGGKKPLPSILFLFLSISLFAQYPNTGNKQRLGYQTTGDGLTWRGSISDTAAIQPINNQNAWVILDTVNLKIYSFDFTSNVWNVLPQGTTLDTTSLSNRINLKVNISDTASMLLPYAKKSYVDTAGRFYARQDFSNVQSSTLTWTQTDTLVPAGVNVVQVYRNGQILLPSQYTIPTKTSVVIAATSYKVGENYTVIFPKGGGGAGSGGSGSLTSISAGTGIIVSPDPITTTGTVSANLNVLMELSDTVSLSNRINTKLTATDTASLSNRINLKLTATDTASLSNQINLKLNAADTASLSNRINAKGTGTVTSVATGYGLSGGTITSTGTLVLDSAVVFSRIRDSIVDVAIGNDTIKILKQEYTSVTTSVLTWTVTPKFPIQLKSFILVFRNGQLLINDQYNLTDTNKITIVSNSFKVGANYTVVTVSGIGSVGTGTFPNPVYPEAGIAVSTGTTWTTSIPNNSSNWNIAFNDKINNAAFSGTTTKTLTLTQYDGGTLTAPFTDLQGIVAADTASMLTNYLRSGVAASTYQTILTNPVTGTGTNDFISKFTSTGSTIGNSTIQDNGTTVSTSSILSTTNYAALDAGNNTHRLTNTLSGNQTWTPSAGFLTSYFNNNVSGGWYYNTSVDNSGFPILSILSTSNDRKKSGITLNSQGTANGTYSPAITFSSLSNSTSYYSAYAAIIGKKTGVGGASGSDSNWNTGHIEFYGTTQATDVNGGVMLNSPSMTLGLGVGIGYDAPPTIKGRLIVSEKIGINQSTPNFALDVSGTANITGATTIGSTLAVTGNITEGGNNVLTNLDTVSLSSRIDSKFNSSGGTISGAVTLSTTTAVPTVLLGKDGSNVVGELNIGGGLVTVGSNLLAIKPFYSADNSTGIIYASGFMNTVSTVYQKITQNSTVTITLPSAVGYAGRSFVVKNLGTGAVISNASNVEPFNSATLGTAILPSGGGKWARLVSDGTNWVIMEAN